MKKINKFGVNVIGFAKSDMGTGEDTRTVSLALEQENIPTCVIPIIPTPNHPQQNTEVDHLISDQIKYNISLFCLPALDCLGHCAHMFEKEYDSIYKIGYWAWEFPKWKKKYDKVFGVVDEIWSSTLFTQKAFSKTKEVPNYHMPLTIDLKYRPIHNREYFNLPSNKFIFFFMFDFYSSIYRKNPFAVINAFKKSFVNNDQVSLVVKVSYSHHNDESWKKLVKIIEEDHRIILKDQLLDRQEIISLFNCCNAFVSLHRSEGFGRCIGEAMLLEKPVICTNYSGNTDFCKNDNSFLVDYNLVKVNKGEYSYAENFLWADPLESSAIERFKEVYFDKEQVYLKTKLAKKNIKENYSYETVSKKYAQRILSLQ